MIRKARPSDCLDLAALSLQVWLHTYAIQGLRAKLSHYALSTFTEHHFQQILSNPACQIWVYRQEEHLVGFISVDLDSTFNDEEHGYEITTLYVSEHFQGQGVGRKLLGEVKVQHGASFWLSAWVNNQKAIDFYQKYGFKNVGESNFELEGELHQNHVFCYSDAASTQILK